MIKNSNSQCKGIITFDPVQTEHESTNNLTIAQANVQSNKQGRILGNPVEDGWAGAVMQKPLEIQKCYGGRTDLPTDTARFRVACPKLKTT